ncbi:MAG TPA: glutamate--tRNA ligase [Blastocatellia bacterium]|nr:glutamate--tRNA ligase [Blastocatellia bacterium]
MTVRVRFAPSPTGHLHVGNVRTALFNWLFARQQGGRFILRIEDTDLERSRREYEEQMLQDLRWLGLDWDEGPDVGGDYGPYRQSERLDIYRHYARQLLEGGWAYPCFCTEEELERERERAVAEHRPYVYSGRCRHLPAEDVARRLHARVPHTIRFRVRPGLIIWDDLVRERVQWEAALIGDFVILKSDGWPVYNFAVVVDDLLMRITHVIRGDGHLPNTPRQLLLYEALGATPPLFAHLSTILGPDGTKLSKRHGATSLGEFRERGYLPDALFNFLALLGWAPPEGQGEVLSREDLLALFRLERVSRAPAIFDVTKLNWMNRTYLKAMPRERVVQSALVYLQKAGRLGSEHDERLRAWLERVVDAVFTHLETLSDIVEQTSIIFDYDLEAARAYPEVAHLLQDREALDALRVLDAELARETTITRETFRAACARVSQRTGRKGRALFHPIRLALTARPSGPELDKLVPIYEEGSRLTLPRPVLSVRARLQRFLQWATHAPAPGIE